jgi:mycothiol synthase
MRIVSEGLRCTAADEAGQVMGWAEAAHNPWMFHPFKYVVRLEVEPAHRRRGVGSALLARLLEELRARGALVARVVAGEDDPAAVGFLTRRGFADVWRQIPSELDLAAFDPGPFDDAAPPGVAITTLADELTVDRAVLHELYELHALCNRGQPELDPVTPRPFEEFVGGQIEGPQAMLDAWFLARDGGVLVGLSSLERMADRPEVVEAGYTAVHPANRRRGIALALKLRTVEHARAAGYRAIATDNNAINAGMLAINTALGFRPGPAIVTYELAL